MTHIFTPRSIVDQTPNHITNTTASYQNTHAFHISSQLPSPLRIWPHPLYLCFIISSTSHLKFLYNLRFNFSKCSPLPHKTQLCDPPEFVCLLRFQWTTLLVSQRNAFSWTRSSFVSSARRCSVNVRRALKGVVLVACRTAQRFCLSLVLVLGFRRWREIITGGGGWPHRLLLTLPSTTDPRPFD